MLGRRLSLAICALSAWACSNVLGFDDITFQPGDGGLGTGGSATGGSGNSAGNSAGGSGGQSTGGASGAAAGGVGGSATGGVGGSATGGIGGSATGGVGGSSTGGVGGSSNGGSSGVGGSGGSGGAAATVCNRWKSDRQSLAEGNWTGSLSGCNAGDVSAPGRENALKLVNLYRWLVGLPAVTSDPTRDGQAQECALMMHANGQLSHTPPASWTCYSANGANAAGKSNIATTPGVTAIDLYIADPGNATTMGHRRWILSNGLGPIGIGSTSGYSCLWVIGGSGGGSNPWTAFPPPGPVPVDLFTVSWSSIDTTGWTIQSNSINLAGAQVSITDGGINLPVNVVQLQGGYGSSYAINIIPQGWKAQAGHTYQVNVTGAAQPISYAVDVVGCP